MILKKRETLFDIDSVIYYVRYSGGAIELHEDYIVIYKNFLKFSWNVYGRTAIMINLADINHFEWRGPGWFMGHMSFSFKHFKKPMTFLLTKTFIIRRKRLYRELKPIFDFISNKVMLSWNSESYRKVEFTNDLKKIERCPKCSAEIDSTMNYCTVCGTKLK